MRRIGDFFTLALLSLGACAVMLPAQTPTASLQGVVTDPSGAVVPGALVQLRGNGPEQRATTDVSGRYNFLSLGRGKYTCG